MRREACRGLNRDLVHSLRFDRQESMLQVGFPKLRAPASWTHFNILRQWLAHCDAKHKDCLSPQDGPLLTRPIDLGTKENPCIRLLETKYGARLQYIAISHPWGQGPHFRTLRSNIEEHKECIFMEKLPKMFRDVGADGDFDEEARRMEDIFSSAYCVLAASSATGAADGLLTPRKDRKFLYLANEGQPGLYVCQFMDDFNEHVLNGPLIKRGWQTYWECGGRIRCETLTRMDNKLASFLGDPNFPSKISDDKSDRGERIRFYEDLYRQYCRFAFTRISDSPIARSRLQRSLLWQRGSEIASLQRIVFALERDMRVPSWSWMAYDGGIDFLVPPEGGADHQAGAQRCHTGDGAAMVELDVNARGFRMGSLEDNAFKIVYDVPNPSRSEGDIMAKKCVLVGKMAAGSRKVDDTTHYVLVIGPKPMPSITRDRTYERVRVGYMAGRFIDLGPPGPRALVKVW
ncbi:hypothetical protein B0T22DRAFT_496887 [Podospora appendiculata]|uniref:Heterokaryon incompatibility domain-containing protein n=1 Tax=Podospora appendiculata TaxID=314037 RepID=A0AAE0XJA7_9PEZI|nr:hypothetical protein B0T22DRAFT_496887 [Podospora appendiculata]